MTTSETAMDEFSQLLADAAVMDDERVRAQMARILELAPLVEEHKRLWAGVKEALLLQDNVLDPVVDGERGYVAHLKEKALPASIDTMTFADRPENAAHIVKAAQLGWVTVSVSKVREYQNKNAAAAALATALMPGGVTYELKIEETK